MNIYKLIFINYMLIYKLYIFINLNIERSSGNFY